MAKNGTMLQGMDIDFSFSHRCSAIGEVNHTLQCRRAEWDILSEYYY